jgi:hypothetical protein
MKKRLTVIFTSGTGLISDTIKKVTGGPYTHAAVKILDSVLESYGTTLENDKYPGVWLHKPDRYDNVTDTVFIDLPIPNLPAAEDEARKLLGSPYGYSDLISSGIHSLFGKEVAASGEKINICSEAVTRILRAGGLDILPDVKADCISPMDLYRELRRLF